MDFEFNNALPIWTQIASQLKERIVTGQYPAGSTFPTVRNLAAEAGVNPNTMQRAMSQLESEGLLATNRTSGRVVTSDNEVLEDTRIALAEERTKRYLKEMKALGYDNSDAIIFIKEDD